jgi:DNA polymerase III delta prime subunit
MVVTVIAMPRSLYLKLRAIARAEGLALTEQARRALAKWAEGRKRKRDRS